MFRLILAALLAMCIHPRTAGAAPPADRPSAAASAEAEVVEGMSWLHSFEYERALAAFERAEKADRRNAMAYWGQAMCYEQLLWGNENVEEARAILARMRRNSALTSATPVERDWVATLDALFGDGDRVARLAAYAAAMGKMAASYPDEVDVAAFHGLALMATRTRGLAGAHPSTHGDETLAGSAEQEEAGRIFARILQTHPRHPGALHYLIHAYDDPANAYRALDAARVYATVVPESSHARHMPAHVFVQLGMWDDAIASDEAAAAAADAKVVKDNLPVTATDFHPLSWLVYEYAQAGRFDAARRAIQRLQGPAEATQDPRLLSLLATLRSRLAVESHNVSEPAGPGFVNYDELFALGFHAAERGDLALAERARIRLGELARQPRYADRRAVLEIMALQVGAAIRAKSNDVEGALALLADATKAERALPASIGPPALIKPAQEQYAEQLYRAGRGDEARVQFDGALERAPRRRLSLQGRQEVAAASSPAAGTRALPVGGAVIAVILALVAIRRRRARAA